MGIQFTSMNTKPWWVDILTGLIILSLVGGLGLGFWLLWQPVPSPISSLVEKYVPRGDGDSWYGAQTDIQGKVQSYRSVNSHLFASGQALTGSLSSDQANALSEFALGGQTDFSMDVILKRLQGIQVYVETSTTINIDGSKKTLLTTILRTSDGDYELGLVDPGLGNELIFNPPVRIVPANLEAGTTWNGQGKIGSNADYRFAASVDSFSTVDTVLGPLADCRRIVMHIEITPQGGSANDEVLSDTYCAGVGWVKSEESDTNGKLILRTDIQASTALKNLGADKRTGLPAIQSAPMLADVPVTQPTNSSQWSLTRVAKMKNLFDAVESTIPPQWIPSSPPIVLTASYDGELAAFAADDPTGLVRWSFRPSGTIYSPPGYDPQSGMIYFGTTNKQLVALDSRGLFAWSYPVGDNIASRPVVVNGVVVFGCEDRNIYGLDAATGKLVWSYHTGGAVVSSPAAAGGTVIIGSDDSGVYAFQAQTGELNWSFAASDSVEAPIVVKDGTAYIASRDKNVYALQTKDGSQLWSGSAGRILRTAPAVSENKVFVTDDDGYVTAFDRKSGGWQWRTTNDVYRGNPVWLGDRLLLAGDDHQVHFLDQSGDEVSVVDANIGLVGREFFAMGGSLGGGAVWLVDSAGVIWRYGPQWEGTQPLVLRWAHTIGEAPLQQNIVYSSPFYWKDSLLVVDQMGNVFKLDSKQGVLSQLGKLEASTSNFRLQPQISGDTLLAVSGNNLIAFHLPDLKQVWQYSGPGIGLFPPQIANQQVVWMTVDSSKFSGRVVALNLDTGKAAWQTDINQVLYPGNILINKNVVYANAALAAIDLSSGRILWRNQSIGIGVSGAALNPDGSVLYTGTVDSAGKWGIAALNTQDGNILWSSRLNGSIGLLDQLFVSGDILVACQNNIAESLSGLDVSNGSILWRASGLQARLGTITVENGLIYETLQSGMVEVRNVSDGKVGYRYGDTQSALAGYSFAQQPVIDGKTLVVSVGWTLMGFQLPGSGQ